METVQLIITDFIFATEPMISLILSWPCLAYCRTGPTGFSPRSPDASLNQQLLSRLQGNASYLDLTANVRGSLAAGGRGFSRHTHEHMETPQTPPLQGYLVVNMYARSCMRVLKGEFVCECECLHITQQFFFFFF